MGLMAGPCGCPLPTLAGKEAWPHPWALALPTPGAGPNGAAVTEISLLPPSLPFFFFFLIKKPSQELRNESPTIEFQRLPLQMGCPVDVGCLEESFPPPALGPTGIQSRKSLPGESEPLDSAGKGVSLSSEAPALHHG